MEIYVAYQNFMQNRKALGNSKDTLAYYQRNLKLFLQYTGDNMFTEDISVTTFEKYQIYLVENYPYTKKTSLQTYARAVKVFLRWCNEQNYISIDTGKLILLKSEIPNILPLTDHEAERLFDCFDESFLGIRNKLVCLLMLDSGLRRGEVVTLQKNSIQMSNRSMLVFGKGSKERLIPFGKTTQIYMRKFISFSNECCPYLIQNGHGEAITLNTIKMFFQKLKKSSGIERVYPHLLRHTFATNYILDGGNIEELRILMGHTTITMTQKYLHLAAQQKLINANFISHVDRLCAGFN